MKIIKYITFLRGINVGGKNIIKMDELKKTFEKMNFTDVKTYIQSGNVIFHDCEKNKVTLTKTIEERLSQEFNYPSRVVIFSLDEYKEIVENAPDGFGINKEKYLYDVWFLKEPLTWEEVARQTKLRQGVDKIYEGKQAVYASRLAQEAGKSYFSKLVQSPIYQLLTIRNWNTTQKIYTLMKPTVYT